MMHRRLASLLALALGVSGLLAAHGSTAGCGGPNAPKCAPYDGGIPNVDAGEACRFACPVTTPAEGAGGDDYAGFADPFFTTYCVRCHSTSRTQNCSTDSNPLCRNGAPPDHNWDDPASIRRFRSQIRAVVAVGDQLTMPPDLPSVPTPTKPAPSCEERFRIARWIDAAAPGLP